MSKTFGLVIDFIIDTERSDAYPVAWCPRCKALPPLHLIVVLLLIGNVGWAHEDDSVTDLALERRTAEGPVRGKTSEPGAIAWLGVPFADVAERWALPKPPPARGMPLVATNYREHPLQMSGDGRSSTVAGSEDCLYLDIYAPAEADPEERLPVMFWIYGGGQTSGSSRAYDGSRLSLIHI